MRDTKIYEKYLNMKPTEHKKIDFKVHFDSKLQMFGMILFAVGMICLLSGLFLFGLNALNKSEQVDDDNNGGTVVENTKDFTNINSFTDQISVKSVSITENSQLGTYDASYIVEINQDVDELAYKLIFKMKDNDVVSCEYLTNVHVGDTRTMYYSSDVDLSKATGIELQITTKEDLIENYGYSL